MEKQGFAFGDFIISEKIRRHATGFDEKNLPAGRQGRMRGFFLLTCGVLVVLIIFFRLFYLQIIEGSYYRYLADNNRTKTIIVHAPRGIIMDRNKTPLVFNVPGFRINDGKKTIQLTKEEAITLLSQGKKNLEMDSLREYPYKETLSHVLGYIGQISEEELEKPAFLEYKGGDIVGKMGIEKEYEAKLKGTDEKQLVEVDSQGKTVRKLGQTDPVSGEDVRISIDLPLQKAAFEAMRNVKKGAIIVSSPNGEVLVMLSKPSFDPNLFTLGETYKASVSSYITVTDILLDNENQPLLNRAISGEYPPGSTFKLVVAAAGLEDKIIDENYQVEDTGILRVGEFSFANWYYTGYGKTEGTLNVIGAIRRSNDIFFYKLAEKIGISTLSKWAQKFGLGKPLGIDLPGELTGTIPTEEWKQDVIGEPWYLGDTYHYGIGQGYLLTTPLQINGWTQAIANNGTIYKPHLLLSQKSEVRSQKFLSEETVSLIRKGMIDSCSKSGVAWPLFDFKVSVACKTGTAEHGDTKKTTPHAWITLFAPAHKPEIIITVLAEESGEGSNIAAPIAKKILESYFEK